MLSAQADLNWSGGRDRDQPRADWTARARCSSAASRARSLRVGRFHLHRGRMTNPGSNGRKAPMVITPSTLLRLLSQIARPLRHRW